MGPPNSRAIAKGKARDMKTAQYMAKRLPQLKDAFAGLANASEDNVDVYRELQSLADEMLQKCQSCGLLS